MIKIFETKEVVTEKRKKKFYRLLMGYWIVVPVVYFAFTLFYIMGIDLSFDKLISENLQLLLNLLMLSINLILAYILYATDITERKKDGISGFVLKFAMTQQLIMGNIVGVIISFLASNELPDNPLITEEEKSPKKTIKAENKKGVTILLVGLGVLSLGIAYANWRISNAS